jgi:hypothetical protein
MAGHDIHVLECKVLSVHCTFPIAYGARVFVPRKQLTSWNCRHSVAAIKNQFHAFWNGKQGLTYFEIAVCDSPCTVVLDYCFMYRFAAGVRDLSPPGQLWGRLSLLFGWYKSGRELRRISHRPVPSLLMSVAVHPLICMPSWRWQGQLHSLLFCVSVIHCFSQ